MVRLVISMFLYWILLLNMFTYGSWLDWQNIRILLIFGHRYTWCYCSYFCKFCARRLRHRFEVRTSSAVRIRNLYKTWNLTTSFSIYSSMLFFCCYFSCWLSVKNGVIYAFVVPALLIILVREQKNRLDLYIIHVRRGLDLELIRSAVYPMSG